MHRIPQQHHWARWLLVLVAMAIVGHDLLMAGGAHAQPEVAPTTTPSHSDLHHAAIPATQPSAENDTTTHGPAPGHETGFDGCSTIRQLVQRLGDTFQLDVAFAADPACVPVAATPLAAHTWWREPTAPPDVIRALVQVYLI